MEPDLSLDPISRLNLMIDLAELGVWDFEPGAKVLGWNARAKVFFGIPEDAAVTYDLFLSGVHPDDRERVDRSIQSAIHSEVNRYATEFRTVGLRDQIERVIFATGVVVQDDHQKPVRLIGVSTDKTRERRHESELKRLHEQADAASNAKSQFIANVSHEIRTPLGSIIGFADLALDSGLPEAERSSYIETVKRNGNQLLKIVNEILDLSKVEIQKFDFEKLQVPFDSLIQDLRDMFKPLAEEKKLRFDILSTTPVPKSIETDPTRLKQILTNLISNAIKFTSEGHVAVEVSVSPQPEVGKNMHLEFCIKDTGIGIPKEHRSKLFQPFSQADSSMTRRFGGTGLGLSLSQKLARALGGDLKIARSEPNEGSRFLLNVPDSVCTDETEFIDLNSFQERVRNEPLSPETSKPLAGIRVLVADDARDNQILVSRFLRKAGAVVDIAENGQEAIDKAESGDYDVVLMDLQMPVVSGYTATETLREHGFQKPIIALTAHAMKEERERCLRAGFTDHMTKPIDRERLLSEIGSFAAKLASEIH